MEKRKASHPQKPHATSQSAGCILLHSICLLHPYACAKTLYTSMTDCFTSADCFTVSPDMIPSHYQRWCAVHKDNSLLSFR